MHSLNIKGESQPAFDGRDSGPTDTARFWDKIAADYSRKPVANPVAFERKIAITKQHLTPERVVLDIGCGTGSLALILAPFARHVHGLDVSGEMIRIARAKASAQEVANVTFHQAELDGTVPFEPESLDVVCAYSLLHLVEDPLAALRHIHRLLKPGGAFIASNVCLGQSFVPYGPVLRVMRWLGKAPYVNVLSRSDMLRHIERAGFVDVTCPDVGAESEVVFTVARKPGG